jgi:hypothetical protein
MLNKLNKNMTSRSLLSFDKTFIELTHVIIIYPDYMDKKLLSKFIQVTLLLPADVVASFVVVIIAAAVVVAVEDAGLVVVEIVVVVAGTAVVEAMDDPEHRLKDPED